MNFGIFAFIISILFSLPLSADEIGDQIAAAERGFERQQRFGLFRTRHWEDLYGKDMDRIDSNRAFTLEELEVLLPSQVWDFAVDIFEQAGSKLFVLFNERGRYLGSFYNENGSVLTPTGILLGDNLAASIVRHSETLLQVRNVEPEIRNPIVQFKFHAAQQYLSQRWYESPSGWRNSTWDENPPLVYHVHPETLEAWTQYMTSGLRMRNAFSESQSCGRLDFRCHPEFQEGDFFIVDGTAYDNFDMGNFIWGYAMRRIGFDYNSLVIGSQLNATLFTSLQTSSLGIYLNGDSKSDQRAIFEGYYHDDPERPRGGYDQVNEERYNQRYHSHDSILHGGGSYR